MNCKNRSRVVATLHEGPEGPGGVKRELGFGSFQWLEMELGFSCLLSLGKWDLDLPPLRILLENFYSSKKTLQLH